MFDGERYHGVLLRKNDTLAVLSTKNGEFSLNSANIKRIKKFSFGEKFWYSNPHNTHYFVSPSAIPMQRKKVNYHNYMLTANSIQVGLSKNISIGSTIDFVNFGSDGIWSLNFKAGFQAAKMLHIGGGVVWVRDNAFVSYLATTLGTKETNVTIGINYKHMETVYIGSKGFSVALSGVHRLSNKISLMIENNLYIERTKPFSVGIYGIQLHFKRNNFRFAYSLSNPWNEFSGTRFFPFVGYSRML